MARVLFELAALDLLDDVDKQLVGAGLMPTCFPSHPAKPVKRSISVRRPSAMFWPIDGRSGEPRPTRDSRRPSSVLRATRSPSPAPAIISGGKWSISSSL